MNIRHPINGDPTSCFTQIFPSVFFLFVLLDLLKYLQFQFSFHFLFNTIKFMNDNDNIQYLFNRSKLSLSLFVK